MFETITAIAILAIVVYVHEIGHHVVAKRLGIEVIELSLGFGKKLWQWISPKSGTAYTLRLLPFGGYNEFLSEADVVGKHAAPVGSFDALPVWKRFLTIASGPAANLLFALIVSASLWVADCAYIAFTAFADAAEIPVVESTQAQDNMFILSIQTFGEMIQDVARSPSKAVEVIGGPVGAVLVLQDIISNDGVNGIVSMLVLSSVSVGLFNLLPIPGLDGCQLLTLSVEKIWGNKLPARLENIYEWLCLVSVGILFCIMIYNDISVVMQSISF